MKAFEELKESTKKDIIIDRLMRSKGVYLLVSKPKVGKSLFALQLANSIANGKPFLGHEILKPSPVLYITTELSDSQLKDRCNLLGISFEKNKFFVIDRSEKQSINFMDIEYQIKEFAEEFNGRILILDMLKDIDFNIAYDINSYQDISQKLMPKIRSYADRDFPDEEEHLHKDKNQVFSIAEDTSLDYVNPNIIGFIKYAIREKDFDFNVSEIINKANLMCTPTQLGKLLNTQKDLLEQEGFHISKYRTTEGRMYHIDYEEPSLENE